ncbi:MAG TPA: hypothetical protein VJ813_20295 [Vicinamibacterales bacterium]|nr:hypothetical protein [Vicinamibacterales bacterium]
MTRNIRVSLVAFVLFIAAPAAFAQTVPPPDGRVELAELVLKDGSRMYGTVERETDQEVVFRTQAGAIVTARRQEIASLRVVRGRIEGGEFIRPDLHRSRLFFAPTGRSLDRGQVSIGVFEFLAPFVQVGVTDQFSIGGGTPLVFGFDEGDRPFWVTPKLQVLNTGRAQAAVGILHVFGASGDFNGGIAYGVATFGSSDNAVTAGAGLAYADDARGGVVMVGGERRVHRNVKLMTENYVWKNGDGILSGGVRFLGERLSADLALAMPIGVGEFFAFPVVNFVYVF